MDLDRVILPVLFPEEGFDLVRLGLCAFREELQGAVEDLAGAAVAEGFLCVEREVVFPPAWVIDGSVSLRCEPTALAADDSA